MTEGSPVVELLAPELKKFYDTHNIELSGLLKAVSSTEDNQNSSFLYRFVRLNPRYNSEDTLRLLKEELQGRAPLRVPWLVDDEFYALPDDFALSTSNCFQSGRIYGMDVSSGASVSMLLSHSYDKSKQSSGDVKDDAQPIRVLDLCCCPGLKLCAIADRVPPGSTVVGVDVSDKRMALCSKIVQKYQIETSTSGRQISPETWPLMEGVKIQLYCQDGTTFGTPGVEHNLIFDSRVTMEEQGVRGNRKRKNKSARARERKRLKEVVAGELPIGQGSGNGIDQSETKGRSIPQHSIHLFDRVLVDAECSTDGSLKHLREKLKEALNSDNLTHTQQQSNELLTDKDRLASLLELQRRLLVSGYRLLKPGGRLIYSTCSLSQDQNENIVQWLLDECKDAYLIPVECSAATESKLVQEGSVAGTIRFYPNLGQDPGALFGDGFFVAKIGKRVPTS